MRKKRKVQRDTGWDVATRLPGLPSPVSSLPRSSNSPRRAASTAQIYDARNSYGEIRTLKILSKFPVRSVPRDSIPAVDIAEGDGTGEKREKPGMESDTATYSEGL